MGEDVGTEQEDGDRIAAVEQRLEALEQRLERGSGLLAHIGAQLVTGLTPSPSDDRIEA